MNQAQLKDDDACSIGVDTGGTFSDIVLLDRSTGVLWSAKTSSTPDDPSIGFIDGIDQVLERSAIAARSVSHVFHGTTVATNGILESKGAATALVTTRGFRHVTSIGRHDIPRSENLYAYVKPPLPVPASCVLEIGGRLDEKGVEVEPLIDADIVALAKQIEQMDVRAVAVCLLHSYANPAHERRVEDVLNAHLPGMMITISSDVLPTFREYERSMTVLLNAYVMPLVSSYVGRLEDRLKQHAIGSRLLLMKSSGGVAGVETIRRAPVQTALSGPAAGAVGCRLIGQLAGYANLIGVDIGGTSADICLIANNEITLQSEGKIAAWPLQFPMVDISTIGAGGGSIARVTDDGRLAVGPDSAGASPGPVCYGRGGVEPTVTDAHLVLGRLPEYLLGGTMRIDRRAARQAIEARIARPLGLTVEAAAEGILAIADNHMVGAIRLVSVQRGHDPRDFALVPFGGAGPLHGVSLAHLLDIPRIVVPPSPGVLSAIGLLASNLKQEFGHVILQRSDTLDMEALGKTFAALESQARAWLDAEAIPSGNAEVRWWADLRYAGQGSELRVEWSSQRADDASLAVLATQFHAQHERTFTFAQPDTPLEIVAVLVEAIGHLPHPVFQEIAAGTDLRAAEAGRQQTWFDGCVYETPVYDRAKLGCGATMAGPVILAQLDCTTVIPPGYTGYIDRFGNLIVEAG